MKKKKVCLRAWVSAFLRIVWNGRVSRTAHELPSFSLWFGNKKGGYLRLDLRLGLRFRVIGGISGTCFIDNASLPVSLLM